MLLQKFLQLFYNMKNFYLSIILRHAGRILTESTLYYSASKALSVSPLVTFFRSVFDSLSKKFENCDIPKKRTFYKTAALEQRHSRPLTIMHKMDFLSITSSKYFKSHKFCREKSIQTHFLLLENREITATTKLYCFSEKHVF